MSWEVAKAGIDLLAKSGKVGMMMFGGEPFLNFPLMKKMVTYASSLPKVESSVQIITNATIFTEAIGKWLLDVREKMSLTVQLSIDGPPHIHDRYRIDKNGKGSSKVVNANAKKFIDILGLNGMQLNVHGCLNPSTIGNTYEIYKWYVEELGIPYSWLMPVHSGKWKPEDAIVYKDQLRKIKDDLLARAKALDEAGVLDEYAPLDKAGKLPVTRPKPCSAGDGFITITADGGIWPCHEFYYNDPEKLMKIGDVFTGIDEEKTRIFRDYDSDDLTCDKDCPLTNCYRCPADNMKSNGSMFAQIKGIRCLISKAEDEVIRELEKEMKEMGIFKNTQNNTGCCGEDKGHINTDGKPNDPGCGNPDMVLDDGTVIQLDKDGNPIYPKQTMGCTNHIDANRLAEVLFGIQQHLIKIEEKISD